MSHSFEFGSTPGPVTRGAVAIEEDTAAAVVAEAVAIAMEAEATETAAAVIQIAAAVAAAADKAAQAAERARDARAFAAKKAAETIAREAALTAVEVQTRADAAALQVAEAAARAVEDLLAFGSQMGPGRVAVLLAKTVLAAAEATADEAARAAAVVATAVAEAAAQMVQVNAASDDAYEVEVSAAADALVGLTTETAWRVALDTQQHADGAASAAREAATALEVTATATRSAKDADSTSSQATKPAAKPVVRAQQGSPSRTQGGDHPNDHPKDHPNDHPNDYATFNGTLHALSGLALGDGSAGMTSLLTSVAELAAAVIPVAHGVGITWSDADRADEIVATTAVVHEVNALDNVRGQGPGTSAAAAGRTMRSGSLGVDTLWPEFGPNAARLGVHSVIAVPLTVDDQVLGSVNVYSLTRDGFDDGAVELAEAFAGTAARFLHNGQTLFQSQRLVGDLRTALKTRAVIDHAIGIMMSRSGYSPQEAFNGLRTVSQANNLKLHLVAERLVRDAVRRAQARSWTQ